jgi:hypothetical protein
MTGSTTTDGVGGIENGRDPFDHLGRAQHSGLDRVGADVVQHRPRLLFDQVERQGKTPLTPSVFWTVMAVMAVAA